MFFSKIFGIFALIALAIAYPPVSSYSNIKLHHDDHHSGHGGSSGHHSWNGGHHADLHSAHHNDHHHDHHDHLASHPEYKFTYGVRDPHTEDNKDAWEHRDGDKVQGGYSLSESDRKRTVKYKSDKHHGLLVEVKASEHHDAHKY